MLEREGQSNRNDWTVPSCATAVFQQSGKEHIPSLFHGTQSLVNDSSLYLPDSNCACVVALSTSQGEDPHVQKIGWHLDKPRNLDFIYLSEISPSAFNLSFSSQ